MRVLIANAKTRNIEARSYASLTAAVASIGYVNKRTLVIDSAVTVTAKTVVPSNITIVGDVNGSIQNDFPLTFEGAFSWPDRTRAFTGTANVMFATGSIREASVRWWSDVPNGTSDNTAAFTAALYSHPNVFVPKYGNPWRANVVMKQAFQKLYGQTRDTQIKAFSTDPVIKLDGVNYWLGLVDVFNLTIDGNGKTSRGLVLEALAPNVIRECIFDRLYIQNVKSGIHNSCSTSNEIYKNHFVNIFIQEIGEQSDTGAGIWNSNGSYNRFYKIEIDKAANGVWAIKEVGSNCNYYRSIQTNAPIYMAGVAPHWENIIVETIYAAIPPSTSVVWNASTAGEINGLVLTNIDPAKCPIGMTVFNTDHTITHLYSWGTLYPNYGLLLQNGSRGSTRDIFGLYHTAAIDPASPGLAAWNVL